MPTSPNPFAFNERNTGGLSAVVIKQIRDAGAAYLPPHFDDVPAKMHHGVPNLPLLFDALKNVIEKSHSSNHLRLPTA